MKSNSQEISHQNKQFKIEWVKKRKQTKNRFE